jgi:hypothetical protein
MLRLSTEERETTFLRRSEVLFVPRIGYFDLGVLGALAVDNFGLALKLPALTRAWAG